MKFKIALAFSLLCSQQAFGVVLPLLVGGSDESGADLELKEAAKPRQPEAIDLPPNTDAAGLNKMDDTAKEIEELEAQFATGSLKWHSLERLELLKRKREPNNCLDLCCLCLFRTFLRETREDAEDCYYSLTAKDRAKLRMQHQIDNVKTDKALASIDEGAEERDTTEETTLRKRPVKGDKED